MGNFLGSWNKKANLRLALAVLFAGSVPFNVRIRTNEAVLANTVESYGRGVHLVVQTETSSSDVATQCPHSNPGGFGLSSALFRAKLPY